MTTTTLPPLLRAATSTFESLALLVAEPALAGDASPAPMLHAVSVGFRGPARGRLVLRVSDDVRAALAANMLGVADPAPALQVDALGEVANVICGNLLPALAGSAAVFRLAAPMPLPADGALHPADGERRAETVAVAVEAGRAELVLFLVVGDAFPPGA